MGRFRASAFALAGVAALLVATAADGQSVLSGKSGGGGRIGASIGIGKGAPLGGLRMRQHHHVRRPDFGRPGFDRHDFRRHFGHRHHHGFDRFPGQRGSGLGLGFGLYGFGGYWSDYDAYRDSDFFMAYTGPRTDVVDGRVVYDYDRAYPYDHYGEPRGAGDGYAVRAPRCTVTWTRDEQARRDVPVRICRQ